MRKLAFFHGHTVQFSTKFMFVYCTSKNSLIPTKMQAIMKFSPGISLRVCVVCFLGDYLGAGEAQVAIHW